MKKLIMVLITIGMTVVLAGCWGYQKSPKTKEEMYKKMLSLKVNQGLVFTDFPKHLLPVRHLYQGTIFETEEGKLQLVCSFPNQNDTVNRYPFYFMKDNHGNYWTMYREVSDDNFHIYRNDSTEVKDYFKELQDSLAELNDGLTEVSSSLDEASSRFKSCYFGCGIST